MGPFFVYILKSTVYLFLFFLFYKLLLSRETFFRFNRLALLGISFLSFGLPFLVINTGLPSAQPLTTSFPVEAMVLPEGYTETPAGPLFIYLTAGIYLAGILFFLFRTIWSFFCLHALFRQKGEWIRKDGLKIGLVEEPVSPFSWMNRIIISRKEWEENQDAILMHEKGHIVSGHSWDLLWMQVCAVLHWFNPVVWLIRRELQNIHEYEADEYVLSQGVDPKRYQLLLIEKAVGSQRFTSMANSFNHSKLKNRISMMLKGKSNPWARLKYVYILPLSAIVVAAFARPEISTELEKISTVSIRQFIPEGENLPEKMTVHITGDSTEVSADTPRKLENELILLDGKEITKEELENISVDTIESVSILTDSATKLYGEKGKNGVVLISTHRGEPVAFQPQETKKKDTYYFVDNKEVSEAQFRAIDPARIESITVNKVEKEGHDTPVGVVTVKLIKW